MDSTIDKLERLAALHRAGSLTDAEYADNKAKVLAEENAPWSEKVRPQPSTAAPLNAVWQKRFAFFSQHGSPYSREGGEALRTIPFWQRRQILFNVWGYLFGPFYMAFLGLPKRAISLTAVVVVLGYALDQIVGEDLARFASFGWPGLFAMSVNYCRYIKVTEGRDEWNPLADLFTKKASSGATP